MRERIRGLDELRGIAILVVAGGHTVGVVSSLNGPFYWPWGATAQSVAGAAAVDLFFIISGFLITTILLTTRGQPGYLRVFYARRAARILPLAVVVIGVSAALYPQTRSLAPSYLLFVNNYAALANGGQTMIGLTQMWSLAIEEHFYIVLPLIVATVPRRYLWLALGAIILVSWTWSLAGRLALFGGLYPADWATHLKVYVIGFGAWVALVRVGVGPRPWLTILVFLAWTAVDVVLGGQIGSIELPLLALLIGAVWLAASGRFALNVPPLRWLGVRCYGLYLIHMLIGLQVVPLMQGVHHLIVIGASLGVTVIAAALSYRYLERPILSLAPGYEIAAPLLAHAPSPSAASRSS